MKAVILAAGQGKRLGAITKELPKPMIEIGGKPILWHILKMYSSYGINEFIKYKGLEAECEYIEENKKFIIYDNIKNSYIVRSIDEILK